MTRGTNVTKPYFCRIPAARPIVSVVWTTTVSCHYLPLFDRYGDLFVSSLRSSSHLGSVDMLPSSSASLLIKFIELLSLGINIRWTKMLEDASFEGLHVTDRLGRTALDSIPP